jgi:Nucleoside 2-deoxyribosyltransferase like
MFYIEAPNYPSDLPDLPSLFLAGGITGCPDWQKEIIEKLKDEDIMIFNPRRKSFDIKKKEESSVQIKWERDHLKKADMISFWFCKDQIQPIVLFELGKYAFSGQHKIFIGVEPGYPRETDVMTQVGLEMDVKIQNSLDKLAEEIKKGKTKDWVSMLAAKSDSKKTQKD